MGLASGLLIIQYSRGKQCSPSSNIDLAEIDTVVNNNSLLESIEFTHLWPFNDAN